MPGGTWDKRLLKKMYEAVNEDLDDDEIREAVAENINLSDLTDEIFSEDEEIKKALKNKIRDLIIKNIENIDDLDELDGDFCLTNSLPEDLTLEKLVSQLLESDEELVKILKEKIGGLVKDYIEESVDNDDLPDNLHDALEVSKRIETLFQDENFKQEFDERFQEVVKNVVENHVLDDDSDFVEKLQDDENLSRVLTRELEEFIKSRKFMEDLKEVFKQRMLENEELSGRLADNVFGKMAEVIVDRLFDSRGRL